VSILTFGVIRLAPGDPAQVVLRNQGAQLTAAAIAQMRAQMGLNDPLPVQYGRWLGQVLRFDFGLSVRTGQPAWHLTCAFQCSSSGKRTGMVMTRPRA